MNLYQYVGSNPATRVDPRGTDFIAIADRAVAWYTLGTTYHYAIMYWRCDCPFGKNGTKYYSDGYTKEEIVELCGGEGSAEKLESVELIPSPLSWTVWGYRKSNVPGSSAWLWDDKDVWISEITYKTPGTYDIMPIWENTDKALVKAKWNEIIKLAKAYQWAEQEGFAEDKANPTFKNWPRSMYKTFGTNSNTFVIDTIKKAGLVWKKMDGVHPGDNTPSQNVDDAGRGQWHFFRRHTPWTGEGNRKPEPTD